LSISNKLPIRRSSSTFINNKAATPKMIFKKVRISNFMGSTTVEYATKPKIDKEIIKLKKIRESNPSMNFWSLE
jgi:hypothetical protein